MKRISAILLAGVATFAVNTTLVGLVASAASQRMSAFGRKANIGLTTRNSVIVPSRSMVTA